jgi:F-type H+-transporting ATPase subunit delta
MKVSNSQYANALYEAAKEKSQSEIDEIVANFVKVLAKNNQVKNAESIIKKFIEIWNKKEGIVEAEVTTARKLESHQVHKVESFVKEKYNAKNVELKNIIDKNVKGGIIVKVGDEVMDGSIGKQLQNLKKLLTN